MRSHWEIHDEDAPYKIGERVRVTHCQGLRWLRGTVVCCEGKESPWPYKGPFTMVTVDLDSGGRWGVWLHMKPLTIYRLDPLEQLAEACD